MKLKVFSTDGSSSSEKEFDHFPSFEGDKGQQAIRQVLIAYQANARQGNASTKTRAEVSGTGKKPFRQKGSGRARQGNLRSPIWRKGGVVFGPKPRDYSQKVNRKVKALAFSRALFDAASNEALSVIEKWDSSTPKTKEFNKVLSLIAPEGKVLILDDSFEDNTVLSARNIARVAISDSSSVNVGDLVRYNKIIASEKSISTLIARANGGNS